PTVRQARQRDDSQLGGEQPVERAGAVEAPELGVAADGLVVDQDLRHGPVPGQVVDALAERGVVVEVHFLELEAPALEERLRVYAVAAPARRVQLNSRHVLT